MKRSMVFILFFVSAPLLLAARVVQQLYMLDSTTGFYADGFSGIGTAVTVLCFALTAVTFVMVWLSHPKKPNIPSHSKPLAAAAFFAALCLIISATASALSSDKGTNLAVSVLGFAAAVAIAWYGVSLMLEISYPPLATTIPVLYATLRLVLSFIKYTGEITVTDTVFDIATMCFILLFFYSSGKLIAGVGGTRTHVFLYAFGLGAAFFCADSALARLVIMLTHSSVTLHGGGSFDISYIGIAVYAVVMIWVFTDKTERDSVPAASEAAEGMPE